jgi:copper ion binding protein
MTTATTTEAIRIPVEGMTCQSCVGRITRTVRKVDGVEAVKVSLGDDSATVRYDPARVPVTAILAAIAAAGYDARPERIERVTNEPHRSLLGRLMRL